MSIVDETMLKPPKAGDRTKTPRTKKAKVKMLSPGWMVVVGASLLFPLAPIRSHGEGQEGERVRDARLHHPPQQAVVWRDLQETRAPGCEGSQEVCPADDEDQVCGFLWTTYGRCESRRAAAARQALLGLRGCLVYL